ncbi:MAG: DUF4175 family protein [Bacteroidota bacterium]
MEVSGFEGIKLQLRSYKKKYYKNLIIRGSLISSALLISLFLIINFLEFNFWFNSSTRTVLLFLYLFILGFVLFTLVVKPLIFLIDNKKQLSDEEAAVQIGKYFPEVKDKLLNIIQLSNTNSDQNTLIKASIGQKSSEISVVPFSTAIDLSKNKKFLKYLTAPLLATIIILLFVPQLITESSTRIISFREEFEPEKPFSFDLRSDKLQVFRNEDFLIEMDLKGKAVPDKVKLLLDNSEVRLSNPDGYSFEYKLSNVQFPRAFQFEAAGYRSKIYQLEVIDRPKIRNFQIQLDYPDYTGKTSEVIENNTVFSVPEGTSVDVVLKTFKTNEIEVYKNKELYKKAEDTDNEAFTFSDKILKPSAYDVELLNEYGKNNEKIKLNFEAIEDRYPKIEFNRIEDTILYNNVLLGGNINDDYGITDLSLFYAKNGQDYKRLSLKFSTKNLTQNFFYNWELNDLGFTEEDKITYYIQVTDNDAVNGKKTTKTGVYTFKVPSKKEVRDEIEKNSEQAENQIDKIIEDAKELNEKLKEAEESLRGEKQLDWKDEKLISDLIKKKEEITKELEELQKQNELNNLKRERFNEQQERIKEKAEQLQELMDELLDEETKKLYDELKKLLEQQDKEDIQDALQELQKKEGDLENELERALELFKKMQFEYKLEETIQDLNELAEKQQELSEETQSKESDLEKVKEKQEEIGKEYDEVKEELDQLNELNNELKRPEPLQDTEEEKSAIEENLSESKEQLDNSKRKKASQSQQQSSESMQQLSKKLQQMQANMETVMLQENIQNLRDIVDNLVKLSFEQERILSEFSNVNQSDPRFVQLSQDQLKLREDSRIVQDSLMSLASRIFQIQSFITREVTEMTSKIESSLQAIKERKKREAVVNQQFAMTSINNLAILLDDVLQQMQMQMAESMGMQSGQPQKGNQPTPSLSELQEQLNQQIESLKKGGKSGRELSQELAKLASEQEKLRKMLEQQGKKSGSKSLEGEEGESGAGGNLQDIIEKMEETELDLVNKNITQETINRQKEILTRMLESEESLREREREQKREAETATEYEKQIPKAFEDYIRARERELEILKTVPIELKPYFKKEVNKYFRRLENSN